MKYNIKLFSKTTFFGDVRQQSFFNITDLGFEKTNPSVMYFYEGENQLTFPIDGLSCWVVSEVKDEVADSE